jgi:hypothetical protein
MEYRLSLHAITLGYLGLCLVMLAIGWILDLFRTHARQVDHKDEGSVEDRRSRTDPRDAVTARRRGRRRPVSLDRIACELTMKY